MTFALTSSAFKDKGAIPSKYTGEGENVSPALEWHGAPTSAKSFVLIMEDPDAPLGTFRHWAVYNIQANVTSLSEAMQGMKFPQAMNDAGLSKYYGPMPPKGHGPHRYFFRLAALDIEKLDFAKTPTIAEVRNAAHSHIIASTVLMGTYERH